MTTTTQDRVSYSYGFKVPGQTQYSSTNVNISYSTDLRPDEAPEQALERARRFVLAEADRELEAEAPRESARVEDEAFDPNNQVHYRIAQNVFDHLGIKSEKSRLYKLHNILPGKPVKDIRRLVEEDMAAFRQQPVGGSRRPGRRA